MKRLKLLILALAMICPPAMAQLRHVKGFNSVGIKAGTGICKTGTVGLSHNYYFAKRWSVATDADFEFGRYGTASYFGALLSPGAEFAAWQPLKWFYLHLAAHLNLGVDKWDNADGDYHLTSFVLGGDLGFNIEMYVYKRLSVIVAARQHCFWRTNPGEGQKGYYFKPQFLAGIRYSFY